MMMSTRSSILALGLLTAACGSQALEPMAQSTAPLSNEEMLDAIRNDVGWARTVTPTGTLDTDNEYFQSLGTNGRTCGSCHLAEEGWSITPKGLRARFDATGGTDPIFRPHDAANAPNMPVSTVDERRAAYSLMLSRGLVRVGLPVKPTSEFVLVAADDPYGWASANQLSMFRRPLPTTNLRFLTVINWDGRNTPATDLANIRLGLKNQSNGATVNHAQAPAPIADEVRDSIVDLENSLTTAQSWHDSAGLLNTGGATGGPWALAGQPFTPGANDASQPGFTNRVFTLYDAWKDKSGWINSGRRDIADGQRVFNEKTFSIGGGRTGTCSGCHSVPNVGSSPSFRFFDVGVSDASRRRSDVPLYTFQNIATGETIQTTDAGRALISGKWEDMNRFKVPSLRGLSARAPYFHDGSAKNLDEVVDHYESHFGIQFSNGEKKHLVKFLESL